MGYVVYVNNFDSAHNLKMFTEKDFYGKLLARELQVTQYKAWQKIILAFKDVKKNLMSLGH